MFKLAIPDGVAALQACVPSAVPVVDFAWVDLAAVTATKSLNRFITITRTHATELLYLVFANLESDVVGELFAELEKKHYDRYLSSKLFHVVSRMLDGNDFLKSHKKTQAKLNRYDTIPSKFNLCDTVLLLKSQIDKRYHLYHAFCQLRAKHEMQSEISLDMNYLVDDLDPDVRATIKEQFKSLCKAQFIKKYPTLMEDYLRYIEDSYIKNEEELIKDCKYSVIEFLHYVCDPSRSGFKIRAISQDKCFEDVVIESDNDVDKRMECILNAIFSKQYFRKIFTDRESVVSFAESLWGSKGTIIKIGRYEDVIFKKMQAILSEWDVFPHYFQSDENSIKDLTVLECCMPNLLRDARVSEKKKNWQVLKLTHLKKNSIFAVLPKDVLKVIVRHTATPIP